LSGSGRVQTEDGYVRRRDFIKIVAGSAATWPLAVRESFLLLADEVIE
jgi:hypothetical protein